MKHLTFTVTVDGEKFIPVHEDWEKIVVKNRELLDSFDEFEWGQADQIFGMEKGWLSCHSNLQFGTQEWGVRFFPAQGIFAVSAWGEGSLKEAIRIFTETEFFPEGGKIHPLGMRAFHTLYRVEDLCGVCDDAPPLERFFEREKAWQDIGKWLCTVVQATCRTEYQPFQAADLLAKASRWIPVGEEGVDYHPDYTEWLMESRIFAQIYGDLSERVKYFGGGKLPRITLGQFAEIWAMIAQYRLG